MRLSESLRRGILESFVGGIINKFRLKSRRDILVFEEIIAQYIKLCEDSGHKKEMREIGAYWGYLTMQDFLPPSLKGIPITTLANTIGAEVWHNIGLLDYMHAAQKGNIATLETKNEYITRTIGKNEFVIGKYGAIQSAVTGKKAKFINAEQSREKCTYTFEVEDEPQGRLESKSKSKYNELNRKFFECGYSLKDGLKMKLFRIADNKLTFRNHRIIPLECTLFSIIGNKSLMLDGLSEISCDFFKKIIRTENIEEGLPLIKKLMQVMGWGTFKIIAESGNKIITFEIENAPCGLQKEPDNWDFLVFMLLGYMRVFDSNFRITKKSAERVVNVQFAS